MKSRQIWELIAACLRSENPAALIQVVESNGASPGKAGFRMAVAADGTRVGTIGGGAMEVKWVEQAVETLRSGATASAVKRVFHTRETKHEQSGLICSGSQTNLLCVLTPADSAIIEQIIHAYDKKQSGVLRIVSGAISFSPKEHSATKNAFTYSHANAWTYEENIGVLETVYIVGSGHVGLALSRIMRTLDFHVVAIDDRADAPTFIDNTFAHTKHCLPYDAIADVIEGADHTYAAIVTTAYKSDEAALKAIASKSLKYIGLMGSAAKTQQIFDDLRAEGVAQSFLDSIHSPIGLPMASHTPEEIAISIAAEIINVRNSDHPHE